MKLIVENLGPIKHGEIDLTKDFYVFVGYNNSGKTYMSQLLWTVLHTYSNFEFSSKLSSFFKINEDYSFQMNESIIKNLFNQFAKSLIDKFLLESFNTSKDYIHPKIVFHFNDYELIELISEFKKNQNSNWYVFIENDTFKIRTEYLEKSLLNHPAKVNFKDLRHYSNYYICFIVLGYLLQRQPELTFLPSTRTFLPSFYQYIFRYEKEKREKMSAMITELKNKSANGTAVDLSVLEAFNSPFTSPVNSLINYLYTLNETINTQKEYEDLLKKLIEVLQGDIVLKQSAGLAPIEYKFKLDNLDLELPLFLSSSSVNQLTCLYLFFKYWAEKKDNFLIIDEIEQNLHPENQLKLLDILIQFSQRNQNKVLITTHSPLITDAVNNYLMLGALENRAQVAEEMGMIKEFLTAENTGIYYFNGDRIQEYIIGDYGTIFKDFKAVIDKVEEQKFELGNMLFQQNEKKAKTKKKAKQTQKQAQ